MATLQQVIDQIQDVVGAITGIRAAPHEPPDNISQYPFAVAFCENGVYNHRPIGVMTGVHTLVLELHVCVRNDLTRNVATAMGYAKSVPNAILLAHKNGTLTALEEIGEITYEFEPMVWGPLDASVNTIGFRFRIRGVKTQDAIA